MRGKHRRLREHSVVHGAGLCEDGDGEGGKDARLVGRSAEPVPARPTKTRFTARVEGVLEDYKATKGTIRFRLVGTQAGNCHSRLY